uniref:Uncharacterized protein n=1 Tax=Alexandrium catenella TaxID=2925 RepID=A0A7S1MAU0_ALECA|mmetsp:Transcript_2162/g.5834  ORF Transcript_2162/g.5834 Transcript_2162/m.5834 type:complete len:225 (+) Transcript_2162:60-734(+)
MAWSFGTPSPLRRSRGREPQGCRSQRRASAAARDVLVLAALASAAFGVLGGRAFTAPGSPPLAAAHDASRRQVLQLAGAAAGLAASPALQARAEEQFLLPRDYFDETMLVVQQAKDTLFSQKNAEGQVGRKRSNVASRMSNRDQDKYKQTVTVYSERFLSPEYTSKYGAKLTENTAFVAVNKALATVDELNFDISDQSRFYGVIKVLSDLLVLLANAPVEPYTR